MLSFSGYGGRSKSTFSYFNNSLPKRFAAFTELSPKLPYMKKLLFLFVLVPFVSQAQLKGILDQAKDKVKTATGGGGIDIAGGLREALQKGVNTQVTKLTAVDGFLKNDKVKILFPEELKKVENTLRKAGMGKLADDGIKSLNRAAEDAVKEATPVFVDAIRKMTITDAKNILMGKNDAATQYLQTTTKTALYAKFNPIVKASIGKVGADQIWTSLISKYNKIPLVTKVNPDINDYVTNKALEGVFVMIALEELNIRQKLEARTSPLLKKVFAMQDKKNK